MASSGSGYDLSASTFSPDGRLFQVEYASKAVDNAGLVIGIKATDGIVLGVSKPILHKLVVPSTASYKRIHHVDRHMGMASTGFLPDARVLVARSIDESVDWQSQFGVPIPPQALAERLGSYVHFFTLHGALRPFGASSAIAGYDEESQRYQLFLVEPNGASFSYYGVATGQGKQAAKTELEKLNLHKDPITTKEAVRQIAKILILLHRENKDNEGKPLEMEMSWITQDTQKQHRPVPKEDIQQATEWAKQQLEQEEDEEEEEGMEE